MKKITMNKDELQEILAVLDKFPEVNTFELSCDSSNGIGSILTISFPYTVNGIKSCQLIEISGVDKW
jgi:hypothetical protein